MIKKLLERLGFYRIDDLDIGGHCGCCGIWIPDIITEKTWRVGLCKKCRGGND
jgi:hypothetical protein